MPTPYGSRGGMAFGAGELRVLRRALALALTPGPAPTEDVQACRGLAESVDEVVRESARLRAFLLADLARYRSALPGALSGYLTLLQEALETGYAPTSDDLAALGALRGNPAAAELLAGLAPAAPTVPAARRRMRALPGGRTAAEGSSGEPNEPSKPSEPSRVGEPKKKPVKKPAPAPAPAPAPEREPEPGAKPRRPIPTPGEVFPPRRKPAPPPKQRLAAG